MNEINKGHFLGANCHSFFKFSQYEARRYQFFLDVLEKYQLEDCAHNELHEEPLAEVNCEGLLRLKEKVAFSWANYEDKIDLNSLLISQRDPFLPEEFDDYIQGLFCCRQFEAIKKLFDLMKHNEQINIDRVADEFYVQAAFFYSTIEFIQLIRVIPIDINRQIGYSMFGFGLQTNYLKKPLLNHAAESGNLALVKYLIEEGADIYQLAESGETLFQSLQVSLNSWKKRDETRADKILAVINYIETITQKNIKHGLAR